MSAGQVERLLVAESDYQAAREFRSVAEEVVKLRESSVEMYTAAGTEAPEHLRRSLADATRECKLLSRICLRHAARRLDASLRAEGKESEMESQVVLFDIQNPVLEAA